MGKKILIIEDDADIRDIISFILEEEGYEVVASATGEETKDLMQIRPDLILLDLRLEGTRTSGSEICLMLKTKNATKNLPVILVSAEADIQQVAKECGANDYLPKPFDLEELSDKIKENLCC
jgi:two-component system response regulator VicR